MSEKNPKIKYIIENAYDGISAIRALKKYNTYSNWMKNNNLVSFLYDKNWWKGWDDFVKENPNWCDVKWNLEEDKGINDWKKEIDT